MFRRPRLVSSIKVSFREPHRINPCTTSHMYPKKLASTKTCVSWPQAGLFFCLGALERVKESVLLLVKYSHYRTLLAVTPAQPGTVFSKTQRPTHTVLSDAQLQKEPVPKSNPIPPFENKGCPSADHFSGWLPERYQGGRCLQSAADRAVCSVISSCRDDALTNAATAVGQT